ncbi:MAG TPA: acyl-CoA dehydrogenase family protein [Mycobacterium sp.]
MFDFEPDPEYQRLLDWADAFVRAEVEPLDYVFHAPYDRSDADAMAAVRPLMRKVRDAGLWACHLPPELGGGGYGQVKLALLNEILGRSAWGPVVFGCQAPDSGNAEILAHFGTPEQRDRFLRPLLDATVVSCFSMTEPQAGADPRLFTTTGTKRGEKWILNGEKWFASNARWADFFIVMVVSDPTVPVYSGASMFIVPAGTAGLEIVRNVAVFGEDSRYGAHGYLRFNDVELPADSLLGDEGAAFKIAQVRLGGGRIHHAMRTVGSARRAFDMMCERAVSRNIHGGKLGDLSTTKERIAQSWIELEQFRLLVLRTASTLLNGYPDSRGRTCGFVLRTCKPHGADSRLSYSHGTRSHPPGERATVKMYFCVCLAASGLRICSQLASSGCCPKFSSCGIHRLLVAFPGPLIDQVGNQRR